MPGSSRGARDPSTLIAAPGGQTGPAHDRLQLVDLIERRELQQAALRGPPQPGWSDWRICRHSIRAALRSRALTIVAASGRSQFGAPGWVAAR